MINSFKLLANVIDEFSFVLMARYISFCKPGKIYQMEQVATYFIVNLKAPGKFRGDDPAATGKGLQNGEWKPFIK